MKASLYYTAPSNSCFDELRLKAIELWREVDTDNDKYGYASSKIDRIKNLHNVHDNFMFIVAMFDINNQALLAEKLSPKTREEVRLRMIDGGNPEYLIVF